MIVLFRLCRNKMTKRSNGCPLTALLKGRAINDCPFRHFVVSFRGKRNKIDKEFYCVSLTKQLTVLYSISFVERNG
jgi:hypothetical protein